MRFRATGRRPQGGLAGRAAIAALAACVSLVAVLALAAPADAGLRTFKLGVVTGGPNTDEAAVRQMRRIEAETLRVVFNWNEIQTLPRPLADSPCRSAVYTGWRRYDALVSAASRQEVELLPVFLGSPRYVAKRGSQPPHSSNERAFKDYRCFVRAVVKRYGFGGEYFSSVLAGDPQADPIGRWQAWNEPNIPIYAARQEVNPTQYARLLKATSKTVRAVNPKAKVVLAGMPERVRRGVSSHEFLRRLYRVKNVESKFDVVAMHPYAENYRGAKGVIERTRDTLRAVGDRRRPLWITESGYATNGQPGHFLVKSERGQAHQLAKTFEMMRRNKRRFKLGTVLWYSWRDVATYAEDTEKWPEYAGLYFAEGNPKRSCNRFAKVAGGERPCRPLADEPAPLEPGQILPQLSRELLGRGARFILPSPPE